MHLARAARLQPNPRHAAARRPGSPAKVFVGLLALSLIAQFGVRLWFAAASSQPTANPDEIGYLAAARIFAGGARTALDLSGSTFYQSGYPFLIAPAWAISHVPATVYRLVLVENGLISTLTLPLAYLLARRLRLDRMRSLLIANAAALLPCAVLYTGFAMSDAVLPVFLLGWLLATHSWLSAPAGRRGALLGALAAALAGWTFAIHSRGELVAGADVFLVGAAALMRWRRVRECLLCIGVLVSTGLAARTLDHAVQHRLYPSGIRNLGGNVFDRLSSFDGWMWTLRLTSGQVWYQLVATGGLAGIGLVGLVVAACRKRLPAPTRLLAATTVALFLGIAFATSAAMNDAARVGTHAYNRYLYCLTPALVVIGCAVILRATASSLARSFAAVTTATVATAVIVEQFSGDYLRRGVFVPMDAFETSTFTRDWAHLDVVGSTVVGLILLAAAVAAARVPRAGTALFAATVLLPGMLILSDARAHVSGPVNRAYDRFADGRRTLAAAGAQRVAVDTRLDWRVRMTLLYDERWGIVEDFDPSTGPPPGDAQLVLVDWDGTSPTSRMWKGQDTTSWRVVENRKASGAATPAAPHFDGWVAWQRTSARAGGRA